MTDASQNWEAVRTQAFTDFRFFCSTFLKIKPKPPENEDDDAEDLPALVPFVFNDAQNIVYRVMLTQLSERGRVELTVLKARQFGLSTFFIAWAYWNIWRRAESSAVVVVPNGMKMLLDEFFISANTFYTNTPEWMRPPLRGPLGKKQRLNKADIHFEAPHNSRLIGGIDGANSLRGHQFDILHLSECAFYKDPEDFVAALAPSFNKKRPGSTWVFESTPQEGWFHDQYDFAKESGTAIFLPWYVNHDQYSLKLKRRGRSGIYNQYGKPIKFTEADLDEREAIDREIATYNKEYGTNIPDLTDEQLYWRQSTLRSKEYLGDVERFNKEYPRDEKSAFLHGSHGAFKISMPLVEQTIRHDFVAGELLSKTYTNPIATQAITFKKESVLGYIDHDRRFGWYIWDFPDKAYTYAIGVDVAGEYDYDDDDVDIGAYSVICVYCLDTRAQVAEWRGSIDPADLADEAVKAGYLYNGAIINLESNNQGWSTKKRLERDLQYPFCYEWEDLDSNRPTTKTMWVTNTETKELLIDGFRQAVRKQWFLVVSEGLRNEMATYTHKRKVGYTGKGNTSDRIIAASLAFQAALQSPLGRGIILDSLASSEDSHTLIVDTTNAKYMLETGQSPKARMPESFYEDVETMHVEDDIWSAIGL